MTLGRTASGAIKIKTDGTTRAVNCACCGGGYYAGGGYACSGGEPHPIFGSQLDYWTALAYYNVLSDGSILYHAEIWAAFDSYYWQKTAPAGSLVNSDSYAGHWVGQLENTPDATFTVSDGADPRCPNAGQKSLNFNFSVGVYPVMWTDDGPVDCGGPSSVNVFACWFTI